MNAPAPINPSDEFDFSDLFDPGVEEMEKKYSGDFLFKYYSENRRDFFRTPRIRFTQKTRLNDRFELTKRWKEFGGPPVQNLLSTALKKMLAKRLANEHHILGRMEAEFASRGISLSPAQKEFALSRLQSGEGRTLVAEQQKLLHPFIDLIFKTLSDNADEIIDKIVSDLGIFSVSETPTNDQLWALYASDGRGFAVGFNAQHPFFRTAKGQLMEYPIFHKVFYTDDKIDDFWKNPHYLFAVKKRRWSFEEEWRMIKSSAECDAVEDYGGEKLFFCNINSGMINSIIFGYDYNNDYLREDTRAILAFDPTIKFQKAKIDTGKGCIELVDINIS